MNKPHHIHTIEYGIATKKKKKKHKERLYILVLSDLQKIMGRVKNKGRKIYIVCHHTSKMGLGGRNEHVHVHVHAHASRKLAYML